MNCLENNPLCQKFVSFGAKVSAELDNFTRREQLEFCVARRAAVAVVLLLPVAAAVAVASVAGVLIAVAVAVAGLLLVWRQAVGAPPRYNRFIKFKETRTQ